MKFNPYSISKIGTYNQCPLKFKFQYIDKIRIDISDNFALQKGSIIHKILEHNFDYDIDLSEFTLDGKEIESIIEIVKKFEESNLGKQIKKLIPISVLEEDFAFKINNKQLELCGYWDKSAWCRGSADLYYKKDNTGIIIDYKSGKDHSDEEEFGTKQATMYAIYMFLKFPEILNIKAIFVFVEHNSSKTLHFSRRELKEYIKMFYNETKYIENTEVFKENVSALCDYCDYYKEGYCLKPKELLAKTEDFLNTNIDLNF